MRMGEQGISSSAHTHSHRRHTDTHSHAVSVVQYGKRSIFCYGKTIQTEVTQFRTRNSPIVPNARTPNVLPRSRARSCVCVDELFDTLMSYHLLCHCFIFMASQFDFYFWQISWFTSRMRKKNHCSYDFNPRLPVFYQKLDRHRTNQRRSRVQSEGGCRHLCFYFEQNAEWKSTKFTDTHTHIRRHVCTMEERKLCDV